jgi:DNA invertase Pin-like site-specific DNA recombinase
MTPHSKIEQITNSPDFGIVAYGRLSREEADDRATPMEEKIALRKQILLTLAKHYHLTLTDEQIAFEVGSGGSLSERPKLLDILERCRRREVQTVLIFEIERLTRDVSDWKMMESAFFKGGIHLITGRGDYKFTPTFDPTMLQILAVLGERERRAYSYRHKAANDQRARKGHLSGGSAPFGYRWDAEGKTFVPVPDEYAIVEEIFARIGEQGGATIAADFNRRGIPNPTRSRKPDSPASPYWTASTVLYIAQNPIYAGYTCKRWEKDREGNKVDIPESEWIWAEAEGDYPHPIDLARWQQLRPLIAGRTLNRTGKKGLLSGLLFCAEGNPMYRHGINYYCLCRDRGSVHDGRNIRRTSLETAVLSALQAAFDALTPAQIADLEPPEGDAVSSPLEAQASDLARQLAAKQAQMDKLQEDAPFLDNLHGYGRERRLAAMLALSQEIGELETQQEDVLRRIQQQPTLLPSGTLALIHAAGGLAHLLQTGDVQAARAILRAFGLRVDAHEFHPTNRTLSRVRLTLKPPLGAGEGIIVPLTHAKGGRRKGNEDSP